MKHTLDVWYEDGSRHPRWLFTAREGPAPDAGEDVVEVKPSNFAVKLLRRFRDCRVGCHAGKRLAWTLPSQPSPHVYFKDVATAG